MEIRSRNFCFTRNNYTDEHIEIIKKNTGRCQYIIFGKEVGEEGTPHLQGFVQWKTSISPGTCSKRLGASHVDYMYENSTATKCATYCKKDGVFWEFGTCKDDQGARNDLTKVKTVASEGGMRAVLQTSFNLQAIRVAEKWLQYCEPGRRNKPDVHWFYGETGTGKSREAYARWPDAWRKSFGGHWYNGYDGHEVAIFDDFRDSWMRLSTLLNIMDRYPVNVEVKGGFRQWRPKVIVFTSDRSPEHMYKNVGDYHQITRRIDHLIKFPRNPENLLVSYGTEDDPFVHLTKGDKRILGKPEGQDERTNALMGCNSFEELRLTEEHWVRDHPSN